LRSYVAGSSERKWRAWAGISGGQRWLDGGERWEDRGGVQMAVLDLVCSVTKV
jgi:hypothetical protein